MNRFNVRAHHLPTVSILRVSIGFIYFWFGGLKFFHGYSPAEELAVKTIDRLTFGMIHENVEIVLLASWECFIGISLIIGKWVKPALRLLFVHMICTFTPLFFFPREVFRYLPYGLSLTGQYIVKNLVIISAALVVWQTEKEKSNHFAATPREQAKSLPRTRRIVHAGFSETTKQRG